MTEPVTHRAATVSAFVPDKAENMCHITYTAKINEYFLKKKILVLFCREDEVKKKVR